MLEQQRNQMYVTTDDTETEVDAFSHIKKDQYLTKVFCWIQEGNTANIIKFYNTFPHLINQLYTPNHWNPLMYAVRYGNLELIQYLSQKGMRANIQGIYNQVSIIHCAVYSGQIPILAYVLNNVYKNANPTNCQISPLKIAMKTGNPKMVELLIAKGAYYTFGDVLNNLLPKQESVEQTNKYTTIDTSREISNALVVEDTTIKDCPIKQTLRWARIRQAMIMRYYAKKMVQQAKAYQENLIKQQKERQQRQLQKQRERQQQMKQQQQQQPKQQQQLQQKQVEKMEQQLPAVVQQQPPNILDDKHKFIGFSKILLNDDYYKNIVRVLVNKGDSILIKNDPVQDKQLKEAAKEGPQSGNIQKK